MVVDRFVMDAGGQPLPRLPDGTVIIVFLILARANPNILDNALL